MSKAILRRMMKMTRYISLFATIVLLVSLFSESVFAETEDNTLVGVQTEIPTLGNILNNSISLYGQSKPSKDSIYELGKANKIEGSSQNNDLYSNKHFKGVATITMTITNRISRDLHIRLYKNVFLIDPIVYEFTIPANSNYYVSMENLDKDGFYYFWFESPCSFTGYVTGYRY